MTGCFGIIGGDATCQESRKNPLDFFLAEEGAVLRFRKADGGRVAGAAQADQPQAEGALAAVLQGASRSPAQAPSRQAAARRGS